MLKFKNKTTLIVLTCLIAASFSIGSLLTNNVNDLDFSNENIGWSGQKPIKNIEFLRYQQYLSLKNPNITNEEIVRKIGERYSILQYAENELNIKIIDKDVINKIKNDVMFHSNGIFDEKVYLSHLAELKLTPLSYETSIRENLKLKELIKLTDIRNNSKKSATLFSDSLFQILDVDLYEMNYQYQDISTVDEVKMRKYYKENQELFITPLTYEVDVFKYVKSDDFIRKEWEKYKVEPKKVYDIKQILVNSKKDLLKVKELIKSNAFDLIAKEHSIDKSSSTNGGLIKGLIKSELTPDFINGLESSDIGETFTAKSSLGYHLIKKESVLDSNITLELFKKHFNNEISKSFRDSIDSDSLKYISKEKISAFKETLEELVSDLELKVGSTAIVGSGNILEKIKIIKKEPKRLLDINKKSDLRMIKTFYKNKLKLMNAIEISKNIENIYNKDKFNWIMKRNIKINKNTEIPQELKDVIYTTPIGEKGDLLIGGKYFAFIVNSEKAFKTKEEDFSKIINSIYNFESGAILIEEAKSLYPIRISKKIISK